MARTPHLFFGWALFLQFHWGLTFIGAVARFGLATLGECRRIPRVSIDGPEKMDKQVIINDGGDDQIFCQW